MNFTADGQPLLVVNTSPILLALADELGPLVGGVKVGGWVDETVEGEIRAAYPECALLYHHWHLYTTPDQSPDDTLTILRRAWARFRSPWLSGHLDQVSWEEIQPIFHGEVAPPPAIDVEAAVEWNCAAARVLQAGLPVPFLLENMPHWPHAVPHEAVRPSFIRAVLERVDAPMLLDLAHAQVSAAAFHMSPEDYVQALPLERVQEIHISGPRLVNGRLEDAHQSLQDEDYVLLRWTLTHTRPCAVTLECFQHDSDALRTMVHRVADIIQET